MAQLLFYRYVDDCEKQLILRSGLIAPATGRSCKWYTPNRFTTGAEAQRYLALPYTPAHRIGPIPEHELPIFDWQGLRIVSPAYGHPGGGLEAATTQAAYVFSIVPLP